MTLTALSLSLRHAWAYAQRCEECGSRCPEALERTKSGILCRACRLRRDGKGYVEQHHVLGRGVKLTVPIHANLHATLTAWEAVYGGHWWPRWVLAWTQVWQSVLSAWHALLRACLRRRQAGDRLSLLLHAGTRVKGVVTPIQAQAFLGAWVRFTRSDHRLLLTPLSPRLRGERGVGGRVLPSAFMRMGPVLRLWGHVWGDVFTYVTFSPRLERI